jgi:hypothetical protein
VARVNSELFKFSRQFAGMKWAITRSSNSSLWTVLVTLFASETSAVVLRQGTGHQGLPDRGLDNESTSRASQN